MDAMYLCVGVTVEAQELFSGDMILVGDAGVGVAMFIPADHVLDDGVHIMVEFENGQHITVKHNTEVVRLEQGNNPFSDGIGGVRTRSADRNGHATEEGKDLAGSA